MQLVVDNLVVTYERKGKGKQLLLLHGWGDDHRTFNGVAGELIGRFDVIALDLPGFGNTQMPPKAWDLDNYAAFVSDFLAKIGISNLYAVIGHSNGGAVAIRGLATGAFKADKLILLASAGIRNSQKAKRMVTKVVAKVGKVTTFWLPIAAKDSLRQKLYGTVGSDMLVVPHLQETFKHTVRQDVQADAAKLALPTLIINADKDPAIPLADGRRYNDLIKGSRLEVLASNSHFIHQQQTQKVAKLILNFL